MNGLENKDKGKATKNNLQDAQNLSKVQRARDFLTIFEWLKTYCMTSGGGREGNSISSHVICLPYTFKNPPN